MPSASEIRRALGFLGFNQRAALVMRELEGRSYAEIAQVLDVSVGAVETLIFRARRALREQLEGGLTCEEAELTLSRLNEQRLSSSERGALRAHLRECKDCAVLERRQRAQRATLKGLGAVPLPASLGSFFGAGAAGGGAAVAGMGIGAKVATVLVAGLVATGIGREVVQTASAEGPSPAAARPTAFVDGGTFSAVSLLTGRRGADAGAIDGALVVGPTHGSRRDPAGNTAQRRTALPPAHGAAANACGRRSGAERRRRGPEASGPAPAAPGASGAPDPAPPAASAPAAASAAALAAAAAAARRIPPPPPLP